MSRYIDGATGAPLAEKPEDMTHLYGNVLVKKTHPRIAFRGKLDSLMAKTMEVQLTAMAAGNGQVCGDLQDLMDLLRRIMAAEVKETPLGELRLLGLESDAIRRMSQEVEAEFGMDHPVPDYRMGSVCVALNALRTQVRETELEAVCTLPEREDLIRALNRASAAVYVIFCRVLSGWYERHTKEE